MSIKAEIIPTFPPNDSLDLKSIDSLGVDSLKTDSISIKNVDTIAVSPDALDAIITYNATDSIVYDIENEKAYLYGNGIVTYEAIELKANYIEFDWVSNEVFAKGLPDSTGKVIGTPVFKEGEKVFEADKMRYNFKSKKGKIYDLVTEEGGGYLHSKEVKKNENDELFSSYARFTTCNADHPHFYFQSKKVKIVPDKVLVTGPTNFVIGDVPTPVFFPFAMFPLKKGRNSGILFPDYQVTTQKGIGLINGGYYFALSPYFDLSLRGDIFSNGSFRAKVGSNYKLRYKFSGNLQVSYGRTRFGESEDPDFRKFSDLYIQWTHRQDQKAHPSITFSSSVNINTTKQFFETDFNLNNALRSQLNSNISFSKRWPGKPFNLTTNLRHSQNTQTGVMNFTLPEANFNVSRIKPFERKNAVGKKKWYEQIGFSYVLNTRNTFEVIDSNLFERAVVDSFRYGIRHSIPISTNFKLFKHVTVSPSFNYNETWNFETLDKQYNATTGNIDEIIKQQFTPARNFNTNVRMNTRIYGMLPLKGKIKAIRHVMNPDISFNYTPDFGTDFWGYYKDVIDDTGAILQTYSILKDPVYGSPSRGEQMRLGFGLNNTLEMKVRNPKDTVNGETKIRLLESFGINSSYNFAADSLRLNPFNLTARTTLFDRININGSSSFDPYVTDSLNRKLDTFVWEQDRKLLRFTNARLTINTGISSADFGKNKRDVNKENAAAPFYDNDLYVDFKIPWKINLGYTMNANKRFINNVDSLTLTQTLSMNVDFNLTKKWKITANSAYDFQQNDFTHVNLNIYRDLHCWEMKFGWLYFGNRQSYNFTINVKASVLQGLRLNRRKDWFDF